MNKDYTQTETPRSLVKAASAQEFPGWAEEIPSLEELSGLSDQAFGDMENRLFPIHTKSAAFYSMIDAASKPFDTSVATYERIDQACQRHGISDDVKPYMDLFLDSFEKSASADIEEDHPYAIDYKVRDAHFQLLPIGERFLVEDSARKLNKMASQNRAPMTVIKEAATKIVAAAVEHQADISDLDPQLRSWSVARYPDFDKAANLIHSRLPFTREEPEAFKDYSSLIKQAAAGEITPVECVCKMETADAALDIPYSYHDAKSGVLTPHEVVFSGDTHEEVEKQAKSNVLVNDVVIPIEDIQGLDEEKIKFSLSKEASDKLKGFKEMDGVELTRVFGSMSDEQNKEFLHAALRQCS